MFESFFYSEPPNKTDIESLLLRAVCADEYEGTSPELVRVLVSAHSMIVHLECDDEPTIEYLDSPSAERLFLKVYGDTDAAFVPNHVCVNGIPRFCVIAAARCAAQRDQAACRMVRSMVSPVQRQDLR